MADAISSVFDQAVAVVLAGLGLLVGVGTSVQELPITSCMQIIYAHDLVTEVNQDADSEPEVAPSIGKSDSANLYRLSLAAATLLRDVPEEHIVRLNRCWDE